MPRHATSITILAILACILATTSCTDPVPPDIAWLDDHAIALDGAEPGQGTADLAPLAAMIGDARIVGLGESTHGTREHFQLKHRLVQYLVEEQGFDIFAIEASTPEAHRLDAYVLGGDGDPAALIGGMYFWTWNTEEVLALVEWMRAHNARSDHKIHFTGFDMQTPDVAAEEVVAFLEKVDPERAAGVKERYAGIVKARSGSAFTTATYTFPVDAARGKTVRFNGWIRTADVDGFAGMWWRIDGPERQTLGFDNMQDRNIAGTTGWTEYAIEMPVPAEAVNINFGFLMGGTGEAWFDGATIALDGMSYPAAEMDLGFEGPAIAGHNAADENFTCTLDRDIVHDGAQSLHLASVDHGDDAPDAATAAAAAAEILAELQARRVVWIGDHPVAEVDRAVFNARIVYQALSSRENRGGYYRDEAMAENVVWLTEQHPDARVVLWAHNYHVSRREYAMGDRLQQQFGDDYLPVGFATASGRYYAASRNKKHQHDLQEPPSDSFEARFAAATAPVFVLDLRDAAPRSEASGWLCEERPFRSIGAMAMDEQFHAATVRELFDLMVFAKETTPARQLATMPVRR